MKTLKQRARENVAGYLFILPNILGFVVFTAFGVGFSMVMSFTDWDMFSELSDVSFVGFDNYIEAFKDKWFIDSIKNNLFFLLFIPVQMLLSLMFAVFLNEKFFGRNLLRNLFYLPYITSFVAISLIWFQLLHPSEGVINQLLIRLGVEQPPSWFGSSDWVKPAILVILTWQSLGYKMLLYLAGLQGIPSHLYEAAEIDGATGVRKFIHITIPLISPVSFFIFIISMIDTFVMWSKIQILTSGGPGTASTVIGYYIYKMAFEHSKMGYASAIAWILFIIIFAVTLIQWRGQKKWVNY
ncbi:sugar ABC transporter permease [Paenibacillus sp. J5C_2022]|uniref:carbohydrate ABC transporter permease n=1 Tax=Paenibacillus sp. J5C2022 TaxID=2977129 RepID=UPI0021D05BA1|nr:sugar ABC transporter permease [Paenibacillus sp. J5C2022]MCU6707428.1 sugar ABC transporter permease [Paenibacillus sp. J5C2022]